MKKTKLISFAVDPELKTKLEENAEKEKRTLSNYIYLILAEAMNEKK